MNDTIAAVATSCTAPSGINIIRISGDSAETVIRRIFLSSEIKEEMTPNRMYLGKIQGKNFNERAFCVLYKAPKSYTGENVAEIHCHGGRGVTAAVLRLVCENGARYAEAGEFTKRAFLNGKMTLDEAEGIAEIIGAETEGQVRNAYKLMSGELTKKIEETEKLITEAAAYLEVKMDYPDETDGDDYSENIREKINTAVALTEETIKRSSRAKTLKTGADIAIIGNPNAGKSSLLNAILKEDRAIVTPIAGTTRDVISASIEYKGIKLNFLDTAGIRESGDEIEKIGIERSLNAAKTADVVVFLRDATDEKTAEIPQEANDKKIIEVLNKTDICDRKFDGIKISAINGTNVENLLDKIYELIGGEEYEEGLVVNERHLGALRESYEHLLNAKNSFDYASPECVTVDLYAASESLGKITGKNVTDEVINEIFSRFCVGK